jgi:glucan phosphoethanolaminetransferase (alkaline phosphatase superfamily)
MKNFNTTRFINLLQWQFAWSKKKLLYMVAGCAAAIIIPALLTISLTRSAFNADNLGGFICAFTFVYFMTSGALIASNIGNKRQRIALFSLPATKLEKFLARYLHLVVIIPLAALLGIIAGDAIQALFSLIVAGNCDSVFISLFQDHGSIVSSGGYSGTVAVLLLLLGHSFMLLCGTIFRRHAWIKTMIAQGVVAIIVSTVIAIIGITAAMSLDKIFGPDQYNVVFASDGYQIAAQILFLAFLVAGIIASYWGAFRIYSRMQAVNNQWHNL